VVNHRPGRIGLKVCRQLIFFLNSCRSRCSTSLQLHVQGADVGTSA
jgi:hypothetical protein